VLASVRVIIWLDGLFLLFEVWMERREEREVREFVGGGLVFVEIFRFVRAFVVFLE